MTPLERDQLIAMLQKEWAQRVRQALEPLNSYYRQVITELYRGKS